MLTKIFNDDCFLQISHARNACLQFNSFLFITVTSQCTKKIVKIYHDLINRYGISVLQMITCMFRLSKSQSGYFLINNLSPGDVTCAARIDYPSGASTFSFIFSGVRVVRSFIICVVFCRSICVLLSFLVIALSVLLPFTASVYPFGIFKLFWNLPSRSKRIQVCNIHYSKMIWSFA